MGGRDNECLGGIVLGGEGKEEKISANTTPHVGGRSRRRDAGGTFGRTLAKKRDYSMWGGEVDGRGVKLLIPANKEFIRGPPGLRHLGLPQTPKKLECKGMMTKGMQRPTAYRETGSQNLSALKR